MAWRADEGSLADPRCSVRCPTAIVQTTVQTQSALLPAPRPSRRLQFRKEKRFGIQTGGAALRRLDMLMPSVEELDTAETTPTPSREQGSCEIHDDRQSRSILLHPLQGSTAAVGGGCDERVHLPSAPSSTTRTKRSALPNVHPASPFRGFCTGLENSREVAALPHDVVRIFDGSYPGFSSASGSAHALRGFSSAASGNRDLSNPGAG